MGIERAVKYTETLTHNINTMKERMEEERDVMAKPSGTYVRVQRVRVHVSTLVHVSFYRYRTPLDVR